MWARNAAYHGYLVGAHELPVYSNVIYFHPNAGTNDTGDTSIVGAVTNIHYTIR